MSCIPWVFPTHNPRSAFRCAFTFTCHIFFNILSFAYIFIFMITQYWFLIYNSNIKFLF